MGYKALVTLDIPKTKEQRDIFYKSLERNKWAKISSLTTAWKVYFLDTVSRDIAIKALERHLATAKTESKVSKVEYAFQLDAFDIVINTI
jgi:hypothetical protein